MSEKDLIFLSTSPNAGAGMAEGSGGQGKEDGGIRYMGETPQKKMKILTSEEDKRWNVFVGNNSWIIQ